MACQHISWPIEIVVFGLSFGLLTSILVRNMHKMNGIHYMWFLCLSGDDNLPRRSSIAIDPLVITANPSIVNSKQKPMSLKYPEFHVSTHARSSTCVQHVVVIPFPCGSARSSTDRVSASGAEDEGSIPPGRTSSFFLLFLTSQRSIVNTASTIITQESEP